MANWSALPGDLLDRISKCPDVSRELLRSVCRHWRSSIRRRSGSHLPHTLLPACAAWSFTRSGSYLLSKRTIYLMGKHHHHDSPLYLGHWLMKTEEIRGGSMRRRLMHPLSTDPVKHEVLPNNFPRSLNSWEFKVRELGQEYVLQDAGGRGGEMLLPLKVVVMWLDSDPTSSPQNEEESFVLLALTFCQELAILRSGDREWTVLGGDDPRVTYNDVIVYRGRLLGVERNGRLVSVGKDGGLALVANPLCPGGGGVGGGNKYLVESNDGLLLVAHLWCDSRSDEDDSGDKDWYLGGGFEVYRLDEQGKTWVELTSLGDNVLFLGYDSTFAASSSSDLHGCGRNCIFFQDMLRYHARKEEDDDDGMMVGHGIRVFEFESGRAEVLVSDPKHYKMFWPPPRWLLSSKWENWPRQVRS